MKQRSRIGRLTDRIRAARWIAGISMAVAPWTSLPGADGGWSGPEAIDAYFEAEVAGIEAVRALDSVADAAGWGQAQARWRSELAGMLGLDPLPERTPLHPVVTGVVDHGDFRVEKLHFQSLPGLYVTGNLYLPTQVAGPFPTILYVCGHGGQKKDGISFGNKTTYRHHGAWFARNGYAALLIDTIQLGEIEGTHHGTYREGRWWWAAEGYTPAGVEAWNGIRALDYLETRPEVDTSRFGVTGRSGGGAYSWWITALDERIKVAVPVAGITSLRNHIVDGCIEGHCDCMFMVNSRRWDFAQVAALAAPRPLLIANTDKDSIFPLDGVYAVYRDVRALYERLGAGDRLGLCIVEGPHSDTQPLRVPAFHWFERFLKGRDPKDTFATAAVPFGDPEELRVFDSLPADEVVTRADEVFPVGERAPRSPAWLASDTLPAALRADVFAGWPAEGERDLDPEEAEVSRVQLGGVERTAFAITSQVPFRLPLVRVRQTDDAATGGAAPTRVELVVGDDPLWTRLMEGGDEAGFAALAPRSGVVRYWVFPRGTGPTAWGGDEKRTIHIRRRFHLVGQTWEGMQTWDVRRALAAVRSMEPRLPVLVSGAGRAAGIAVYAALFEPDLAGLELVRPPTSHREGPILLNVLRHLDLPQAVAAAALRMPVVLEVEDPEAWATARELAAAVPPAAPDRPRGLEIRDADR